MTEKPNNERMKQLGATAKDGKPIYGSDVIVDLLRAAGIEYAAFNPGASFRGSSTPLGSLIFRASLAHTGR